MSTYVIGDVHGCYQTMVALLERCQFDSNKDHAVFVGDIVNRGPGSLEALRWVRDMGNSATLVLGNHDVHLLAIHAGARKNKSRSLDRVLQAPDADELCTWLRQRPLLHRITGASLGHSEDVTAVHAGIYPSWSLEEAERHAREVEQLLCGEQRVDLLSAMYQKTPGDWQPQLPPLLRASQILKYFTRLRVCTLDGSAVDSVVVAPEELPADQVPWYRVSPRAAANDRVVFGHWAALGFRQECNVTSLDTGAAWGRYLSAYRLEDEQLIQQPRLEAVEER